MACFVLLCTVSPEAEACTPGRQVPSMHYHAPTNSLMSTTCVPAAPHFDDCSAPDLVAFGVSYWRRGGLQVGNAVCGASD